MMRKAEGLADFFEVFSPEPLKAEELAEFYCADTMEYRTGDISDSPIINVKEIAKNPSGNNAVLFLGHGGCGKSTELVKLYSELQDEGYCVEYIKCNIEIDLINAVYWDFFILITQKLLGIADKLKCDIDKNIIKTALSYRYEEEKTETIEEEIGYDIESTISAGAGLHGLFKAFVKMSGHIKNGSQNKVQLREKVKRRALGWMEIVKSIATSIKVKNGKMPVLIFEGLDKYITEETAIEIFFDNAPALSQLPFKAIYTFPINLFYSEKFTTVKNYFAHEIMPLIKIHNKDMSDNKAGIKIIKEIVYKRADESLFDCGVLDEMIKKTGGSLRNLFEVIRNAGRRASRRQTDKIYNEDVAFALTRFKSDLTRMIEVRDYDFLADVYNKKEQIQESEKLLKFMRALIVLEYNGERWHDLHPLIYEFLLSQGWFDKQEEDKS